MLVILTDEQILSPQQVCCNCLLADSKGLPRWRKGNLGCGMAMRDRQPRNEQDLSPNLAQTVTRSPAQLPELYECQMGFRVACIQD